MGEGGRSLGGGVVQHRQDQVALIRSSDRFGQRCSQTCRAKRSDDKLLLLSSRGRIGRGRQVFATRARLRSGRRDAVPVRRTPTAAGGFLLHFRPE